MTTTALTILLQVVACAVAFLIGYTNSMQQDRMTRVVSILIAACIVIINMVWSVGLANNFQ